MSHLTASPFHKPSPHDVPRPVHPITPPDTESEFGVLSRGLAANAGMPVDLDASFIQSTLYEPSPPQGHAGHQGHPSRPPTENELAAAAAASSRFRKVSTLGYRNSGLRSEPRLKGPRPLIMVIPPATFVQVHGSIGQSGPRHRLSNGVLMPLFPTIYGQLTAIAREYSLPSTTGICLYLHYTDGGITMTPRVSEETWPFLWSHLFEPRSPSGGASGISIAGRVEFDLDLQKARWYEAWLTGALRETVDVPVSVAPSVYHVRADSRTTLAEDQSAYDVSPPEHMSNSQSRTATRHIPRKLSLVDRFEGSSYRSVSRAPSRASHQDVELPEGQLANALTPIAQEEEPRTATHLLTAKVNNWRASASLTTSALVANLGQPSLDPTNMPNTIDLGDSPIESSRDAEPALNLDDFAWSISSAGPQSEISFSDASWSHVTSVDLAHRLEGSVCLTPTTCTSFGPFDDDDFDYNYTVSSLLPSPDLGQRMLEDVPLTPSTATSWGPASYIMSPLATEFSYSYSIDLGRRAMSSRPATPSTATSWGAPLSWPPSPVTPYHVRTPDIGQRSFDFELEAALAAPRPVFSFPYYDAWSRKPWTHVWPYTPASHHPSTPAPVAPSRQVFSFPYYDAWSRKPWAHVWPYAPASHRNSVSGENPVTRLENATVYPYMQIYAPVYPYFDIYPVVAAAETERSRKEVVIRLASQYPNITVYPAVYPHSIYDIYPAINTTPSEPIAVPSAGASSRNISLRLERSYPDMNIYEPVYPHNVYEIYPPVHGSSKVARGVSVKLSTVYPFFDIYPAVYPAFDIYPSLHSAIAGTTAHQSQPVASASPAPVVIGLPAYYPAFAIYPSIYPASVHEIYPSAVVTEENEKNLDVALAPVYPFFDIYPAVYPSFNIYPCRQLELAPQSFVQTEVIVKLTTSSSGYPESVYEIYPDTTKRNGLGPSIFFRLMIQLPSLYPAFSVYPSVYPYNVYEIYPPVSTVEEQSIIVQNFATYPSFVLYPTVYPHFDLYPSTEIVLDSKNRKDIDVRLPSNYPHISLYPSIYPFFDIYSSGQGVGPMGVSFIDVTLPSTYPILEIYPAVYPHFSLWPTVQLTSISPPRPAVAAPLPKAPFTVSSAQNNTNRKTHAELRAIVMMEDGILLRDISKRSLSRHKSHRDLHFEVFRDGVVSTSSGTLVVPLRTTPTLEPNVAAIAGNAGPARRSRAGSVLGRPLPIPPSSVNSSSSPVDAQVVPQPTAPPVPRVYGLPSGPASRRTSILRPKPMSQDLHSFLDTVDEIDSTSATPTTAIASTVYAGHIRSGSLRRLGTTTTTASSGNGLERSKSVSDTPGHPRPTLPSAAKRSSIVLERIKAFDASAAASPVDITMDSLDQFPMPPQPPVPKLDRSKYPFA